MYIKTTVQINTVVPDRRKTDALFFRVSEAFDEESGVWRRFYLGSSREFETRGDLRIAMFEPGEERPWRIVSRGFRESRKDRILLAKALQAIRTEDLGDLQLRVIADDLRRIG